MSSNAGAVIHEEYNRPRRADPDTVAYLRSLPLDETVASEEVRAYVEQRKKKKRNEAADGEKEKEEDDDDDDDLEYPQSLSASLAAISEIRNQVASLACEEHAAQAIETVARIGAMSPGRNSSTIAARRLLAGCSGYHLHLASHRYGSHVVQTILSCAVGGGPPDGGEKDAAKWPADEDDDEEEESEEDAALPTLTELVLGMADELIPYAPQLAVHVCGSHVFRTLLCALGGVELVLPPHVQRDRLELGGLRRGKNKSKKKKKKKKAAEDAALSGGSGAGIEQMRRVPGARLDPTDSDVRAALRAASEALSGTGGDAAASTPGELQQLACHPSAGPLLVVLIRVLTYASSSPERDGAGGASTVGGSGQQQQEQQQQQQEVDNKSIADHRLGIVPLGPTFGAKSDADMLVRRLLCWDDMHEEKNCDDQTAQQQQPFAGDVIYGLSGEPRGSRVLEAILHTSPDAVHDAVCRAGRFFEPDAFGDYAEHDVSNFVLQALLSTARTAVQAEELVTCVEPLVESGYLLDKSRRRGGVLWRASEMCAKFGVGQEALLRSVRVGYTALIAAEGGGDEDDKGNARDDGDGEGKEGRGKKDRHKKRKRTGGGGPLVSMEVCIPRLVDMKPPEKEGGRAVLDVAGARTVYHMLHFAPKLCGDVLNGIVRGFTCQELEWIANDGLGSRCIMDGILEGHPTKHFSHAAKELLEKLSGRWVALSVERVGHHLVQNLFRALRSMDDKAALTAELASGINRLGGNAMGRSVMVTCAVKEFLEGEDAWRGSVTKQMQREEWLKDVLDLDDSGAKEDGGDGKKKRKRKKRKKVTDGDNYGDVKQSVVESIMSTMSAPSIAMDA